MAKGSRVIEFKDMVDHGLHGVPHVFEILDCRMKKGDGALSADTRQDNESWVDVFGLD